MLNKILAKISHEVRLRTTIDEQEKIAKFPLVREKLISKMIKNKIIKESNIKRHAILITFFGCGKFPQAPGTFASLIAALLWFGVSYLFLKLDAPSEYELLFWLIILSLLFIYGMLTIPLYSRIVNSEDHPSIVIDEVVGQIIALCLTYPLVKKYYFDETWFLSKLIMFAHISSCFIFFRFFDIAKPSFIGWIDRNIKNSFGVMFDDLVCGLLAALINITLFLAYETAVTRLHNSYIN